MEQKVSTRQQSISVLPQQISQLNQQSLIVLFFKLNYPFPFYFE